MIAPLLLVALAASAGEEVVAHVDGVTVTRFELVRRMKVTAGRSLSPEIAIEQVVNDILLEAEGRRMGLLSTPDVALRVRQGMRAAAAAALIDGIVSRSEIPDARLRGMFHGQADLASFDALFFSSRDDAAAARRRIERGSRMESEARIATVARVNAKPSEAPPSMRAEIDPALATAVFEAAPGQLVGPVETRTGFAVARLHRKVVGTDEQFAARRPELVMFARKQMEAQVRKHLGEQLRAKSGVKLDEPFLRSLRGMEATPRELDHVLATVGDTVIRYRDIYPFIRALGADHYAGPLAKTARAWQEVERRLIEESAVKTGLARSPAVLAQRPAIERSALAAAVVARIESSVPSPTEDEIKAYYKRNRAAFGSEFARALPAAAAGAAAEKRRAAINSRLGKLRAKASISIDRAAVRKSGGVS